MKANSRFFLLFCATCVICGLFSCSGSNPLDELEEWDLVYISDSTGWGVPELLARNIERDTGKTVKVHDYSVGGLPALAVLKVLQTDPESISNARFKSLHSDVAEAEVIVFFANPRGSLEEGVTGGMEVCIKGTKAPENCSPELYEQYKENLMSVYEEIFALRNDMPTIIRTYDFYNL
jgi:hypothetical protein